MRFTQSAYSQSENIASFSVSLVLDTTSGITTQEIVSQITAGAIAGDTATGTGKKLSVHLKLIVRDQLDVVSYCLTYVCGTYMHKIVTCQKSSTQ